MAAELAWPVEQIPDCDFIYMRAHFKFFHHEELQPGVFRSHDGGMSANWDRYASPDETRKQAKNPNDNAVIRMPVGGVRKIDSLRVDHTPEPGNRAHAEVTGFPDSAEEITEIRVLLLRISVVVIPL